MYNVTMVTMRGDNLQWLLFQYSVPNKPSKLRVYIWRKLKALRAEQLVEGMYALPLTEKTTERLEWLRAETVEMGGEAALWKAEYLSEKQEEGLIARFQGEARKSYEKIQEMLLQKPDDNQKEWLDHIIRLYADARFHDYFNVQENFTIHGEIEKYHKRENLRRNGI